MNQVWVQNNNDNAYITIYPTHSLIAAFTIEFSILCETIGQSLRLVCPKRAKPLIQESSLRLKVGKGPPLGIASAMSTVEKSTFIKCPHLANVVLKNSIVSINLK